MESFYETELAGRPNIKIGLYPPTTNWSGERIGKSGVKAGRRRQSRPWKLEAGSCEMTSGDGRDPQHVNTEVGPLSRAVPRLRSPNMTRAEDALVPGKREGELSVVDGGMARLPLEGLHVESTQEAIGHCPTSGDCLEDVFFSDVRADRWFAIGEDTTHRRAVDGGTIAGAGEGSGKLYQPVDDRKEVETTGEHHPTPAAYRGAIELKTRSHNRVLDLAGDLVLVNTNARTTRKCWTASDNHKESRSDERWKEDSYEKVRGDRVRNPLSRKNHSNSIKLSHTPVVQPPKCSVHRWDNDGNKMLTKRERKLFKVRSMSGMSLVGSPDYVVGYEHAPVIPPPSRLSRSTNENSVNFGNNTLAQLNGSGHAQVLDDILELVGGMPPKGRGDDKGKAAGRGKGHEQHPRRANLNNAGANRLGGGVRAVDGAEGVRCVGCSGLGHKLRQCPVRRVIAGDCRKCGVAGHMVNDCGLTDIEIERRKFAEISRTMGRSDTFKPVTMPGLMAFPKSDPFVQREMCLDCGQSLTLCDLTSCQSTGSPESKGERAEPFDEDKILEPFLEPLVRGPSIAESKSSLDEKDAALLVELMCLPEVPTHLETGPGSIMDVDRRVKQLSAKPRDEPQPRPVRRADPFEGYLHPGLPLSRVTGMLWKCLLCGVEHTNRVLVCTTDGCEGEHPYRLGPPPEEQFPSMPPTLGGNDVASATGVCQALMLPTLGNSAPDATWLMRNPLMNAQGEQAAFAAKVAAGAYVGIDLSNMPEQFKLLGFDVTKSSHRPYGQRMAVFERNRAWLMARGWAKYFACRTSFPGGNGVPARWDFDAPDMDLVADHGQSLYRETGPGLTNVLVNYHFLDSSTGLCLHNRLSAHVPNFPSNVQAGMATAARALAPVFIPVHRFTLIVKAVICFIMLMAIDIAVFSMLFPVSVYSAGFQNSTSGFSVPGNATYYSRVEHDSGGFRASVAMMVLIPLWFGMAGYVSARLIKAFEGLSILPKAALRLTFRMSEPHFPPDSDVRAMGTRVSAITALPVIVTVSVSYETMYHPGVGFLAPVLSALGLEALYPEVVSHYRTLSGGGLLPSDMRQWTPLTPREFHEDHFEASLAVMGTIVGKLDGAMSPASRDAAILSAKSILTGTNINSFGRHVSNSQVMANEYVMFSGYAQGFGVGSAEVLAPPQQKLGRR